MPSSSWWFTGQVLMPEGLIIGLKDGISLPSGWNSYNNANDLFLRHTTSDGVVGTTGSRSSVVIGSSNNGSHSSGGGSQNTRAGYYTTCAGNCWDPTLDTASKGGHTHNFTVTYRPPSCDLRLIRAAQPVILPLGGIMFANEAIADQALFTTFTGHTAGALLRASATTGISADLRSTATSSSSDDSHVHTKSGNNQALSITSGSYGAPGSGGGSHTHTGGTPTITPNISRATARVYEIISASRPQALIGMWAGNGVPPNWSLVAGWDGRCLAFSSTGSGATTGADTISVSGSSNDVSHSHSFPSYNSASEATTSVPHSSSVSHSHTYSNASAAYSPERYFIKFIKFEG
jgi:hypothetical protein